MKENDKEGSILLQKKPWDDNSNTVWLASTVCLHRNIEKFKFPSKLSVDRRKQIIALVSKELLGIEGLVEPCLIKGEETQPLEKEYLAEHFLAIENYQQAHAGEAFVLDATGEFFATINIQDHIHFQLLDCKGELENSWSRLVKIETNFGKILNYSFLPKYGFLTADPTECGTALIATVYLQVPALIHSGKIDEALEKFDDESLLITGIQGNPTEIIGDILMISNNYTLGITEENIISSLRNFTTKLLVEENSMRSKIRHEDDAEFKDRISRAFGILIHSYNIETVEALNAISLLKLGLNLGWVSGISDKDLNLLFFNCRRAHLLAKFSEKVSQEQIIHKRAEFIHQHLKNVTLSI
jgi:protein arginine kinase